MYGFYLQKIKKMQAMPPCLSYIDDISKLYAAFNNVGGCSGDTDCESVGPICKRNRRQNASDR